MNANRPSKFSAVCFDFKGTLIDHKSSRDLIVGMEPLLETLNEQGIILAVVSRNPIDIVIETLGPVLRFFKNRIYSSGGKGKLGCLRAFSEDHGIHNLSAIAFVDDKPDNLIPVAEETDITVIGFMGSGKYPRTQKICKEKGFAFAKTSEDLAAIFLKA